MKQVINKDSATVNIEDCKTNSIYIMRVATGSIKKPTYYILSCYRKMCVDKFTWIGICASNYPSWVDEFATIKDALKYAFSGDADDVFQFETVVEATSWISKQLTTQC